MFKPEQNKTWIETAPDQVVYISTSVNRPIVVVPGRAPEAAQAYVCILRTSKGYEFYIYLHLIASNLGLLYKWDSGPMSKDMVPQVQQAAAEFTESMGFMMTDLRWRELSPQQKNETFNSLPLFFQDISRFKEQAEEEVLEIEPVKEEIVVEAIEEPVQTVTEGDFVIHEEGYAESKPEREMVFDEIPDIAVPEDAQAGAKTQGQAASEEDILLESLEVKEEPVLESGKISQAKAPESQVVIEMEETETPSEMKISEKTPPAPPLSQPQEELSWEKGLVEEKPEVIEETGPGASQTPAPAPVAEVEEISIETIAGAEPEQSQARVSAPLPEAEIQAEESRIIAEPSQRGEEHAQASPELAREFSQVEKSGTESSVAAESHPQTELELMDEDFKLIVRLLAMF